MPKRSDNPSRDREAYERLQCYTLAHGGREFIHQHVVDAWQAQNANERTKPIGITFSLVGLYLHVKRAFSGRQVQRAHMALARHKRSWPSFKLPHDRGTVTASNVMAAPAGPLRDAAIEAWCVSVWDAFHESHAAIVELVRQYGI